ncbi:hypothetical protein [Psychrosphaera algicola]|uniref:Uncharacterized protein n=1 Tax=Psychrosphaera algicola TaxID=3023714 RepID=A0ABT5FG73_9GAMM|nr:hypothetical protein [Psychrosphaera sp. G1-22]MDC2889670.1 hypothetical protein [Psychrosphaera sp. G1-22]
MYKAVSRILVLAMMLVSFAGQALTYNAAQFCETNEDTHSLSDNLTVITSNDLPASDVDNPADCCDVECCDLDCICIANACSSVAYFSTEHISTKTQLSDEMTYLQQFEQPNSVASLLYRPPIFTS